MTQKWKAGDKAYLPVTVNNGIVDDAGEMLVHANKDDVYVDPAELIHAIPAPDPLTELEREVLATALELFTQFACPVCGDDCENTTPPINFCPMKQARALLARIGGAA